MEWYNAEMENKRRCTQYPEHWVACHVLQQGGLSPLTGSGVLQKAWIWVYMKGVTFQYSRWLQPNRVKVGKAGMGSWWVTGSCDQMGKVKKMRHTQWCVYSDRFSARTDSALQKC